MKKPLTILALVIIGLGAAVLLYPRFGDYANPFNPKDPLFVQTLIPENILANVESGKWVVASYEFGMRCACGFVMWEKKDEYLKKGRVEVHHLQFAIGGDIATLDNVSPPHLSYPKIPYWVKKKARDDLQEFILFVIYEGDRIVFMGFNGTSESTDSMYGLRTEEDRKAMLLKYIRDQFQNMSFYRTSLR